MIESPDSVNRVAPPTKHHREDKQNEEEQPEAHAAKVMACGSPAAGSEESESATIAAS